jgi:hypothetical protein
MKKTLALSTRCNSTKADAHSSLKDAKHGDLLILAGMCTNMTSLGCVHTHAGLQCVHVHA